ncbi:MAG: S24 family peptidase, partial [Tannerella sp.]|nr:S24 family peptidase [Tannerella sp.]
HVPFVGAQKDDICVHVTGNSMMPTYSSGSLLLVRKVEGWMEYFGYGLCYVLFLKDGRRILKEIQKSEIDHQRYVLCVSYNPKNPSEELPRDFIVDVYKVIMTLMNEGF